MYCKTKVQILLIVALCVFFLSACRLPASESGAGLPEADVTVVPSPPGNSPSRMGADSSYPISDMPDSPPTWASAELTSCDTYTGLNLDGFGTDDDEASVCVYGWGDDGYSYVEVMVLCVRFGTGNTAARVVSALDGSFRYNFMTGKLCSARKDAIVIEISNPNSNFGAASIQVFDITNVMGHPERAGISERLNTSELQKKRFSIMEADKDAVRWLLDGTGDFTEGTEIVDLEGRERQGLKLYSTSSTSTDWRAMEQTIVWEADVWGRSGWLQSESAVP